MTIRFNSAFEHTDRSQSHTSSNADRLDPATSDTANYALLHLLQLASATLPVGAYSYSEGLETLCEQGVISSASDLQNWLAIELGYGSIRVEAAVMLRAYQATLTRDIAKLAWWNDWFSATRETAELRQQSWQMGRSLILLLQELIIAQTNAGTDLDIGEAKNTHTQTFITEVITALGNGWGYNFAIAFGLAAAIWQIDPEAVTLAYLSSWSNNTIAAGVKLIPLGQTRGQILIWSLHKAIAPATHQIMNLTDAELDSCNFGLAQASMQHADLYTRLFRS
jgi:urease accessory protein